MLLAVRAPHVPGGADHRRHRGVDDDVAGDVQVGDALVGVDHRQGGPSASPARWRPLDLVAVGQGGEAVEDAAEAVVGARARRRRGRRRSFSKTSGKNAWTTWPKMIGSETFIIVALRCTENSTSSALARAICSARNASSAATFITVASTTSPASTGTPSLSTVTVPSAATSSMRGCRRLDDHRLLVGAEVVAAHGGDVGLGVGAPGAHRVRVLAGVVLDRGGRAAVGVALAQHRVDRAALDLVVAGADVALLVGLRVVGVVGQVVALAPAARRWRP